MFPNLLGDAWEEKFTEEEVRCALFTQKNKKATGLDKLPAKVLKNDLCAPFLTILFNICARTGLIPGVWRKGLIIPILKKNTDDARVPLNYWGITLYTLYSLQYIHNSSE